jgi:hypothetical protein
LLQDGRLKFNVYGQWSIMGLVSLVNDSQDKVSMRRGKARWQRRQRGQKRRGQGSGTVEAVEQRWDKSAKRQRFHRNFPQPRGSRGPCNKTHRSDLPSPTKASTRFSLYLRSPSPLCHSTNGLGDDKVGCTYPRRASYRADSPDHNVVSPKNNPKKPRIIFRLLPPERGKPEISL